MINDLSLNHFFFSNFIAWKGLTVGFYEIIKSNVHFVRGVIL